jgi:hypothetical protein
MRSRTALATALASVAALAAAPAAYAGHAAAKRTPPRPCQVLRDKSGDGTWDIAPVSSPLIDITSADVATGAKTVAAVLRVASTKVDPTDPVAQLGPTWMLKFQIGVASYAFYRTLDNGLPSTSGGIGTYTWSVKARGVEVARVSETGVASGGLVVSSDATSMRWTIPRSLVPDLAKPKQVLSVFNATTNLSGASADSPDDTTAWVKATYRDRAPSCVAAS